MMEQAIEVEKLSIPELDDFEAERKAAYVRLNVAEKALHMYGDVVDLTGESVAERHNEADQRVKAMTRAGIRAGWLRRELIET